MAEERGGFRHISVLRVPGSAFARGQVRNVGNVAGLLKSGKGMARGGEDVILLDVLS